MSKKRTKEHYVQQRYLRFFACDAKKNKVHVYDKVTRNIRLNQPINGIACEGGFYDIDFEKYTEEIKEGIDQQAIDLFKKNIEENFTDKFLSDFVEPLYNFIEGLVSHFKAGESSLSPSVDSLISVQQRMQISRYITYQYLRTAAFRDYFLTLINQNDGKDAASIQRNTELAKLIHSRTLFNGELANGITETISSGIWILGQASGNDVFYTSDNPIHIITDVDKKPGILSDVIFVSYPLLPHLILLVISPKTAKRKGFDEFENQIVDMKSGINNWFNQQRIAGAYRVVLCSNKEIVKAAELHNEVADLSREELNRKFYRI